jgi:hypothetical protein
MLGRIINFGFVIALSLPADFPSRPFVNAASAVNSEYRVIFASASQIERQLDDLGREGYACVSLARPDPGSRVPGIVAILARTANTTGPVATHKVIIGGRDDMKVPLTKSGSEGFHLCGVVLDEEPPNPRDVAVMTRTTAGSWQYDVEVLLRYKESLVRLNTIGRDGFLPVAAAPIDNNRVPDQRNWMVVAERPAANAAPVEVAVRSDPGPTGLGRNLNDSAKRSYRVGLAWKEGNDYVAMMTRPTGGAPIAHAYVVEADAPARMHSLSGLTLADFPYLDRRLFVVDAGVRASNELVEEKLPSRGEGGVLDARARDAIGTIGDHLSRNHGYEATYARVGRDASGTLVLSVAMARKD